MEENENQGWRDVKINSDDEICNEQTPLINDREEPPIGRIYWYRWYILLQFSMLCWIQTGVAGCWSPINKSAKIAYGFTDHDFDLLILWGSVGVVIFLPLFMWLATNKGLRITMLIGSFFVFVGTGLRCIPLNGKPKKILIMAGQLINGFSGGPVCGAAPLISNVWFAHKERVLATSIMLLSGNLGGVTSYLLGPFLVPTSNLTNSNETNSVQLIRKDIEIYLLIEFGFAIILLLMVITFLPNKPPTPPSPSSVVTRLSLIKGLKSMLHNRTCMTFMFVEIFTVSPFYAWTGIMPLLFPQVSQKEMGLIGTMMNVAGIFVGIIIALIADRIKKKIFTIFIILEFLIYLTFAYVVIIAMGWIAIPPFQFTHVGLWISVLIYGSLNFTSQPFAMEILSDLAFPVSEGTSAFVLIWLSLLYQTLFFVVLNSMSNQSVANYIALGSLLATLPVLYFSIPKHNRREEMDSSKQE